MAQMPATKENALGKFLSHLVFENQSLKIGIALLFCIFSHSLITLSIPWQSFGIEAENASVFVWFSCCILVLLVDQLYLNKSAYILRRAYLSTLSGEFETALELYESIGPLSSATVKLPNDIYHLHRAELLTASKDLFHAEQELQLAEELGSEVNELTVATSRFWLAKKDTEKAALTLENALEVHGQKPAILLEQARQLIDQKKDLWDAKSILSEVLALPNEPHFSGENCHQLAVAYISVCKLWSGQAEVAIVQLGDSISRIQSQTGYVDTLRPILAELLSHRAHYYATHKSPEQGVLDLQVAISLCSYPALLSKIELTKEELEWRHGVQLAHI